MILPIILSFIAAAFWATGNHIDKYLISKIVKKHDYRALIIFSTIVAGSIMALIYLFVCNFCIDFDVPSVLILLINSIIYIILLILYFKALSRDDTTVVVIMLQLTPVFITIISPFVLPNQNISPTQLAGGLLIIFASIFITYEPKRKKYSKKKIGTLAIMLLATLAEATWFIIERHINQTHDFNKTIFWSNAMLLIIGVFLLLFVKSYRKSFSKIVKGSGLKIVSLNLINELLNSFSLTFVTCAGTMIPIALVSFTTQGIQPFVAMLIGFVITKLFPKIEKEKITRTDITKRVIAIIICIIGLGFIEFG